MLMFLLAVVLGVADYNFAPAPTPPEYVFAPPRQGVQLDAASLREVEERNRQVEHWQGHAEMLGDNATAADYAYSQTYSTRVTLGATGGRVFAARPAIRTARAAKARPRALLRRAAGPLRRLSGACRSGSCR